MEPLNGWFIMENPMKIPRMDGDDCGYPYDSGNLYVFQLCVGQGQRCDTLRALASLRAKIQLLWAPCREEHEKETLQGDLAIWGNVGITIS